jgi:hypothetical protein
MEQRFTIDLNIFKGKFKDKLKSRCKLADIERLVNEKVNFKEFNNRISMLDGHFKTLENRVNTAVGVIRVDTFKGL